MRVATTATRKVTPTRTAPFDEVSGQIREFLTGKQRDAKLSEFADQMKAKRKVEMLV